MKVVTDSTVGTKVVTVFLKWGDREFAVEVSNEGVVVAPVGEDGQMNKDAVPTVWVDPYVINDKEQIEKRDKGEAPLLVHTYFEDEQEGAPVTVRAYNGRALLGGDGLKNVDK